MLNNTLGILIGFVTVILLFSLLVTTISQGIQNILSVRRKKLLKGVEWLVKETANKANIAPPVSAAMVATTVVEKDVTWIEKDELKSDLIKAGYNPPPDEFDLQYEVMSRYLSKKFKNFMVNLSFALALFIAFIFQLNTFTILKRLSTDAEFRAKLDTVAVSIVKDGEAKVTGGQPYDEVADQAIRQFSKDHPEAARAAEEVSGIGKDRATLEAEMKAALEFHKVLNVPQLVAAYGNIADNLHSSAAKEQFVKAREQIDELALFDFTPWPNTFEAFYLDEPVNFVGVLVSAIFISLGAPFWFNCLKNLVNLRDMLKPRARDGVSQK